MTVVTFQADVFPYVKGDVVELTADEKRRVDAVAKARGLDSPYASGAKQADAVDDARGADVRRAEASRKAVYANAVDQAAVLEAQRSAVPEPANVDALGVVQETPTQAVTGTKPVEGVEVENPQEATNPASGQGVKVKTPRSKK